jgi:hypothetical protein
MVKLVVSFYVVEQTYCSNLLQPGAVTTLQHQLPDAVPGKSKG